MTDQGCHDRPGPHGQASPHRIPVEVPAVDLAPRYQKRLRDGAVARCNLQCSHRVRPVRFPLAYER